MSDTQNSSSPLPKRRGLGRGLDALFEDTEVRANVPHPDALRGQGGGVHAAPPPMMTGGRIMMAITRLQPGAFQPRRVFNDETVHALAQSIAQHGIIQPLLVRPLKDAPGQYEIIAGERRWRAAQKAGLHDVPVVINESMADREALQLGLIENLQREDLNPFDEAAGYQRLVDDFGFSPEQLGDMIGKSRAHVANMIRLLQIPSSVREIVLKGGLSAGHARALIGVPTASALAELAVKKGLSVRQVEKLAEEERRAFSIGKDARAAKAGPKPKAPEEKDIHLLSAEKLVTDALGLKFTIEMATKTSGYVRIDFKNLDQLNDLISRLSHSGPPEWASGEED